WGIPSQSFSKVLIISYTAQVGALISLKLAVCYYFSLCCLSLVVCVLGYSTFCWRVWHIEQFMIYVRPYFISSTDYRSNISIAMHMEVGLVESPMILI